MDSILEVLLPIAVLIWSAMQIAGFVCLLLIFVLVGFVFVYELILKFWRNK
jgi:hypothetical protein